MLNPLQYDDSVKQFLPENVMKQNMGYEDDQQSLADIFDGSPPDEQLVIPETPRPRATRLTRRRTLIATNPKQEEPGAYD